MISEETAFINRLSADGGHEVLALESRCAVCHVLHRFNVRLTENGLAKSPDQDRCSFHKCLNDTWGNTIFCQDQFHLDTRQQVVYSASHTRKCAKFLDQNKAKKWTSSKHFKRVQDVSSQIEAGSQPGGRIICIDLEFHVNGREPRQIAAYEYLSGERIVEGWVKREHFSVTGSPLENDCDDLKEKGYIDVHMVADQLRRANVSKNSLVLSWAVNFIDMDILRNFLESGGYTKLLPDNSNCIIMIPEFKRNLRLDDGRLMRCKLDFLFPLVFPQHPLVDQNHFAGPDTKQLRLMVLKFVEMLLPASKRGNPELRYQPTSMTIDQFFKPANTEELFEELFDDDESNWSEEEDGDEEGKKEAADSDPFLLLYGS